MADLTHRQVEAILKTFMEEHGWQKTGWYDPRNTVMEEDGRPWKIIEKTNNKLHSTQGKCGSTGVLYPDAVFVKGQLTEDSKTIVAEVKPENVEKMEVLKGIGQSAQYLPFEKVKPYLVLPIKWYETLLPVFQELPRLGVITYNKKGMMQLAQRAEDKPIKK